MQPQPSPLHSCQEANIAPSPLLVDQPWFGHIGQKGDNEAVHFRFPFRWQQGLASPLINYLAEAITESQNARAEKNLWNGLCVPLLPR